LDSTAGTTIFEAASLFDVAFVISGRDEMKATLKTLLPHLSESQLEQLAHYAELLEEWNQRINLISRKDMSNLLTHHLIPSLAPAAFIPLPDTAWVADIGSGGGLPAIPLKIVQPQWQLLMVESIRKKSAFLQEVVRQLTLTESAVLNTRVEEMAKLNDFQARFDIVTARAVAAIPKLIKWGAPLLKPEGFWLLWKGASDIPEMTQTAQKYQLQFKIHRAPDTLLPLSPKLEKMCWFVIRRR
jgi:16S rRNA (guanine527-N7)-methyltransferase